MFWHLWPCVLYSKMFVCQQNRFQMYVQVMVRVCPRGVLLETNRWRQIKSKHTQDTNRRAKGWMAMYSLRSNDNQNLITVELCLRDGVTYNQRKQCVASQQKSPGTWVELHITGPINQNPSHELTVSPPVYIALSSITMHKCHDVRWFQIAWKLRIQKKTVMEFPCPLPERWRVFGV